jgi:OB-fold nucleic acid binding domain.
MSVVNIDTTEGQLTVVLFPDQHDEFSSKIRKNSIIKVRGTLDYRNDGTWQVIADEVTNPRIKGFDAPGGTCNENGQIPLEI